MPGFMPAVQPFATLWSPTGGYSLSADQETATLTATDVVTQWIDCTTACVKYAHTGTATGASIRSSAYNPRNTGDRIVIHPGTAEWTKKVDPAVGNPNANGWGSVAGTAPTTDSASGGMWNFASTGSSYYRVTSLLTARKLNVFYMRIRRNAGHVGTHGPLWRIPFSGSGGYVSLGYGGTNYGADAGKFRDMIAGTVFHDLTGAEGDWLDCWIMARSSDGTNITWAELWAGPATFGAVPDFTNVRMLGLLNAASSGATNDIWIGSPHTGTANNCSYEYLGVVSLATVDQYGWESAANPDTSFSRAQRYVQVGKWSGTGTLTTVQLAADISAPSAPTTPDAAAINATSLGVSGATVGAASAYLAECWSDTPALVDSEYVLAPGHVFRGLAADNYTVRLYSVTDDGVPSATYAETGTVTVPAVTYTAPTIGPYPRWVSGELRFYKPTAGTASLATYKVLSATAANGTYSSEDSNAWGGITWRATDGTGQYVTATDLGITVSASKWYRDRIEDSSNLSAEGQTAAYGGDSYNRECLVSFNDSALANRTISVILSHPVSIAGGTYARSPYSTTLNGSGVGSLSLPRLNAATITNGDTGTAFAVFTGAGDQWVLRRYIPDAATAEFDDLTAV